MEGGAAGLRHGGYSCPVGTTRTLAFSGTRPGARMKGAGRSVQIHTHTAVHPQAHGWNNTTTTATHVPGAES